MKRMAAGILALCLVGVAPEANAIGFGAGVLGALPSGDMKDVAQYGYGLYGSMDRGMAPLVDLRLQVETNRFVGEDLPGGGQVDDFTSWGFLGGAKVGIAGLLSGGALAGYYTEVDELDLVPFASLKLGMLDVGIQYKMLNDTKWFAARVGFSFGAPVP